MCFDGLDSAGYINTGRKIDGLFDELHNQRRVFHRRLAMIGTFNGSREDGPKRRKLLLRRSVHEAHQAASKGNYIFQKSATYDAYFRLFRCCFRQHCNEQLFPSAETCPIPYQLHPLSNSLPSCNHTANNQVRELIERRTKASGTK